MSDEQLPETKGYEELEHRIEKIERYWYVTLALAAILGVGGALLSGFLASTSAEVESLTEQLEETKTNIPLLAKQELEALRETTLKTWLASERGVREGIRTDLDDLAKRAITKVSIFPSDRVHQDAEIFQRVQIDNVGSLNINGQGATRFCYPMFMGHDNGGKAFGVLIDEQGFWTHYHKAHFGHARFIQQICVELATDSAP